MITTNIFQDVSIQNLITNYSVNVSLRLPTIYIDAKCNIEVWKTKILGYSIFYEYSQSALCSCNGNS